MIEIRAKATYALLIGTIALFLATVPINYAQANDGLLIDGLDEEWNSDIQNWDDSSFPWRIEILQNPLENYDGTYIETSSSITFNQSYVDYWMTAAKLTDAAFGTGAVIGQKMAIDIYFQGATLDYIRWYGYHIRNQLSMVANENSLILAALNDIKGEFQDSAGAKWFNVFGNELGNVVSQISLVKLELQKITETWETDKTNALTFLSGINSGIAVLNSKVETLAGYLYDSYSGTSVRTVLGQIQNYASAINNSLKQGSYSVFDYIQYIGRELANSSSFNPRLTSSVGKFRTWLSEELGNLSINADNLNLDVDLTETNDLLGLILIELQNMNLANLTQAAVDTLIGNFDDVEFGNNVDDLSDELQGVMPFGAVLQISQIIGELDKQSANEISFEVPFQFANPVDDSSVEISLAWLDDARPVVNFLMLFMLVLGLCIYTVEFVRTD